MPVVTPLSEIYMVNEESYSDKETIIKESSKGHWIYMILEGQAEVRKNTNNGFVTLRNLKEGDVFGEMAMFGKDRGIRSASVIADGFVRVALLDYPRIMKEYESLSLQLRELMESLILGLKETTAEISALF